MPEIAGEQDQPSPCAEHHHVDYGSEYYEHYSTLRSGDQQADPPYRCGEPFWEQAFAGVAREIVARLKPRTVLDAGCAIGFLVQALRAEGVEAEGVDVSEWAISQAAESVSSHCRVGSITAELDKDYDLITCIEVLEHVPSVEAAAAVANLCRHTQMILFSSTPEHFDEVTHINVRPPEHWATLFAAHGFFRDVDFDAGFVAVHAVLFQKVLQLPSVIAGYERWALRSHHELVEVRQHRDQLYSEVWALRQQLSQNSAELIALKSTKTFRATKGLRELWAKLRR